MHRLGLIWKTIKGMNQRMDDASLSLVAAGGAFFVMLSLFPALAALIAIVGFVSDPVVIESQLKLLSDFIPEQVLTIIETHILRLVNASTGHAVGWATLISLVAALWSARRGTDALIQALNRVYGLPTRGGLLAAITAIGITMALMSVVTLAILTIVIVPIVLAFLPLGGMAAVALEMARWGTAMTVVITGIWVLYRFGPNRKGFRIAWITPGALLAIVVWFAASWGFSYYLANFGSYNEIYGSIGAVIALLMFLYLSIFIVLLGATLNAELEEIRHPKTALPEDEAGALPPAGGTGIDAVVAASVAMKL